MPQSIACVRLPPDLWEAFRMQCEAMGVTSSEVLRSLMQQWLGGNVPMAAEGYAEARRLAIGVARVLIERAYRELPDSVEEAIVLIHEANPARPAE